MSFASLVLHDHTNPTILQVLGCIKRIQRFIFHRGNILLASNTPACAQVSFVSLPLHGCIYTSTHRLPDIALSI